MRSLPSIFLQSVSASSRGKPPLFYHYLFLRFALQIWLLQTLEPHTFLQPLPNWTIIDFSSIGACRAAFNIKKLLPLVSIYLLIFAVPILICKYLLSSHCFPWRVFFFSHTLNPEFYFLLKTIKTASLKQPELVN